MATDVKVIRQETNVVPTVLCKYGSWLLNSKERRMVNVFNIRFLKKLWGVEVMGRYRNRGIRRGYGNNASLLERVNRDTLSWFGHMERMEIAWSLVCK